MMMRTLAAALLSALVAGLSVRAIAQTAPEQGQRAPTEDAADSAGGPARNGPGRNAMAACRADMQALCGSVERGKGRKIECLRDNQTKLSAPCRDAIQTVLNKVGGNAPMSTATAQTGQPAPAGAASTATSGTDPGPSARDVHQACKADVAMVCAGVEKGQGRIVKCLKENSAKLSTGCQAAMAERKAHTQMLRQDVKAACVADRQSLCAYAGGGHETVQCLREKQSQLSAGCQQALAQLH